MSRMIEALRSFDRKERFAVLREALGFDPELPRLAHGFREKLSDCINNTTATRCPKYAFLAMDYHLDWIEMALHRADKNETGPASPFRNTSLSEINKNQKDVDLLVAFDHEAAGEAITHLVMIEAKAYLGWTNSQLKEKADRLRKIFGENGKRWNFVHPHFVLMAAKRSQRIRAHDWPKWMTCGNSVNWLLYDLPNRLKITRCAENGKPLKTEEWLVIEPVHH